MREASDAIISPHSLYGPKDREKSVDGAASPPFPKVEGAPNHPASRIQGDYIAPYWAFLFKIRRQGARAICPPSLLAGDAVRGRVCKRLPTSSTRSAFPAEEAKGFSPAAVGILGSNVVMGL